MKTKQIGNLIQLNAEKGYLHKIGTDTYVKSIIMLPSDSVMDYEEVDELPKYTKAEYDAKVEELIHERYSLDKESEIQRKAVSALLPNTLSTETAERYLTAFAEYNAYIENCKERAKDSELYKKDELSNV